MSKRTTPASHDVAVVGGGVVGLCVAEALARRGADVALLEGGRCGAAASAGNAGWVSPGLSNPLPAPGTVAKGLCWMLSPRAPLRVHPVPRIGFCRWIYDFWRFSSPSHYAAGVASMVAISRRVMADFDALAERLPRFEMHEQGVLFVSHDIAELEAELESLRLLKESGYEGRVETLDRRGALTAEPALAADVAGAILAAGERHVRPEALIAALVERLRQQGVALREQAPLRALVRRRGRWLLECEQPLSAGRVVVATGAATAELLAPLGVRLPMQGAKGYSITQLRPALRLHRPVYLLDAKVAVSPFAGALRLAGVLELGATSLGASRSRLGAIEGAAARCFREWDGGGEWSAWAGMRPMAPDGLPVIGPVPGHPGLHLATAHAMLGVTLAPTTAELLAPAVLDGVTAPELAPFSVSRFARRGPRGQVRS